MAEVGRTQPRYGIEKPIPYLARRKSRNALTSARDGDRAKRCAMPRCEPNSSQKRQISYFERSACPNTTEGVPVRFSCHPLPGGSETDLHSRVLIPGGAGDGARERDRDVRGGNRRNGKGSSSSQSAGSREFRQRGFGKPSLAVDVSRSSICLRTAEGTSTEAGNG